MRFRQRAFLLSSLLTFGTAALQASPADSCVALFQRSSSSASALGLRFLDDDARRVAEGALDFWRSCGSYGGGFPSFTTGPGAHRVVTVRFEAASGKNICGLLSGSEIVLYAFAQLPGGRLVRCEPVSETLAHELGHLLGLLDAPSSHACADHIMAALPAVRSRRQVRAEECAAVDRRWDTPDERVASLVSPAGVESSW